MSIQVDSDCLTHFDTLKMSNGSIQILVLQLNDNRIEIDQDLTNLNDYELLCENLPDNKPKFILFNLNVPNKERKINKILFISYIPDRARVKEKMLFAGSIHVVKKNFKDVFLTFSCSCKEEMTREVFVQKCLACLIFTKEIEPTRNQIFTKLFQSTMNLNCCDVEIIVFNKD